MGWSERRTARKYGVTQEHLRATKAEALAAWAEVEPKKFAADVHVSVGKAFAAGEPDPARTVVENVHRWALNTYGDEFVALGAAMRAADIGEEATADHREYIRLRKAGQREAARKFIQQRARSYL